jgi:putative transposase
MPWGLKRLQKSRQLHFLTFSCFHRRPNFATSTSRTTFESSLERMRQDYGLRVYGYVVMPEHVHLLVSEPERDTLARATQSLKQSVARRLALRAADPFWQARYYDFNVWSEMKFVENLRYIHRNPVKRGLVARPEDWPWSSFRHYLTGEAGSVEIESQWTARRREQLGIFPTVGIHPAEEKPPPSGVRMKMIVGATRRFRLGHGCLNRIRRLYSLCHFSKPQPNQSSRTIGIAQKRSVFRVRLMTNSFLPVRAT